MAAQNANCRGQVVHAIMYSCFNSLFVFAVIFWAVLWLVCWTSDLKVGGSTPSPCHRVVSLDKKLHPTLSLSTQVIKMGTWDIASHSGGSSNTLSGFMLQKPG